MPAVFPAPWAARAFALAAAQEPGFVSRLAPVNTASPRAAYPAALSLGRDLDAAFADYEARSSFAVQALIYNDSTKRL